MTPSKYDTTGGGWNSPPLRYNPNANQIFGNKPGDYNTVGFAIGNIVGVAVSFDRIVMPDGTVDWFVTGGFGTTTPTVTIFALDKGRIAKINMSSDCEEFIQFDDLNFTKDDFLGYSLSYNIDAVVLGTEMVLPTSSDPYVGIKGGYRLIGTPSVGHFMNWTIDIGR